MGGRKVRIRRPRVRTADGTEELALPSWRLFQAEDPLEQEAVDKIFVGVSTRKYRRALDALPPEVDEFGTSKSAVSRRFVTATKKQLAEWLGRDLGDLKLAAVMIDGLGFDEHTVLIALGIDTDGKKHVLGIHEGTMENATACGALLDDLIKRSLATNRSLRFVVDGAKAITSAIRTRWGKRGLLQRCQVHKARNVKEHLLKELHASVAATMHQAYAMTDFTKAKRQLDNLAARLDDEHPGAAASVREGLVETLTVVKLGLPGAFARTFATTNPIENRNGTARWITRNVKRWKGGTMILRWCCAAMEGPGALPMHQGREERHAHPHRRPDGERPPARQAPWRHGEGGVACFSAVMNFNNPRDKPPPTDGGPHESQDRFPALRARPRPRRLRPG